MGAGPFDGPLYAPVPPPPGALLTLVHLTGWATFAACLVGTIVTVAAMVVKHHRGHGVTVQPGGGEPPAPPTSLAVFFLGYTILGVVGILFGLVV